ncbi:MAG: hypothetical protein IKX14_03900 [Neisseriaceae bacterium]|nr:hypothetical protein [Neisseriaceae bacterium]
MNIRNNLSAYLYFLPSVVFVIWRVCANKEINLFDILVIIFFACIAFVNIKFIQYIRRMVLWLVGLLTFIGTMPLFWSANDNVAIFIALFLLLSLIIFTMSEYEWYKKIKTNIKKSIFIFSLLFLYFSFNFYQYIENKKADNLAIYICEKSNKYNNIDELNKVFISEEIMNKLYTKEPITEQFGDCILFHYYKIRRPFGLFSDALVSCEIKTDMQGNIISHEIK